MKVMFAVFVALFIASVEGSVVTGTVLSGSGMETNPVEGALVKLRIGESPEAYPSAVTDQAGRFVITVAELPLQFMVLVTGTGIVSQTRTVQPAGKDTVSLTLFCVPVIVTTLELRGELIDSVSGDPLAGVTILFKRGVTAGSTIATALTDSNGWFTVDLVVWNDVDGKAFWIIECPGYRVNTGEVTSAMTISRKTIEMVPEDQPRVEVVGSVIDSMTREPIGNATVVLWTSFHGAAYDTFTTDGQGTFSRMVPVGGTSSEMPRLYCSVIAECHCRRAVVIDLPQTVPQQIDMGQIALHTDENSVRPRDAGGNGFPVTAEAPALCVTIDGKHFVPANRAGFRSAASPQLMIVRSSAAVPAKRITLRHTTSRSDR